MIETVATSALVLGADLGGTSTRVLVAAADGTPVGTGRAGPGNPVSSPGLAAGSLATAVRAALEGLPAGSVRRAVLGVAGASVLADGPRRKEFDAALRAAGLLVVPDYVGDVEVAYAAGSGAAVGAVLVAGTGASAGRVEDGRLVRTAAGHGWLVGDDGSGYWLGREAVRTAMTALDHGHVDGLAAAALEHLAGTSGAAVEVPREVDEQTRRSWKRLVVQAVSSRPPVRLADLARLVTGAASSGDPVAADLVERAGAALVEPLLPLLEGEVPLVLAGGLVGPDGVVTAAVRRALGARGATPRLLHAGPGEAGAAWVALGLAGAADEVARPVRQRLGLPL